MAAWVFLKLGQRLVDAKRAEFRTRWVAKNYVYERPRPELVSLESGLDESLAEGDRNLEADRDPHFLTRLYADGSGQTARDLDELGLSPPRRAA